MSEAGNKTSPSSSNSQSTSTCSQLPTALIAPILARIDQEQRLSACAGVSRSWAKAAAQATPDICCKLSDESAARFKSWGKLHGPYLRTLVLSGPALYYNALPCVQLPWQRLTGLQRLDLARLALPAISNTADSSGGDSPAAAGTRVDSNSMSRRNAAATPLLPSLKQLQLTECRLDSVDTLLQLARSSVMTSLVVEDTFDSSNDYNPAACELVQRLPQLVVLHPGWRLSSSIMPHVAALRNLQDLELNLVEQPCDSCWAALPCNLTRFGLWDSQDHESPSRPRAQPMLPAQFLMKLSHLQGLKLGGNYLSPAAVDLANITQLRHLHLSCTLPQGADGVEGLFDALVCLTQLQHLHLDNMGLQLQDLAKFATLTASSELTHLHLAADHKQPLPVGCAQFMFAADRQLPLLQVLTICETDFDGWQRGWCLDSKDLQCIVSCCPNLQALNIAGIVHKGADVSALVQLSATLTSLTIGGRGFPDEAAPVVAQLSKLSRLSWRDATGCLAATAVQQLTALRGLTELTLNSIAEELEEAKGWVVCEDGHGGAHLILWGSASKGPVWMQLQAICDNSPDCVVVRERQELVEKVHDLREQVQDLKQQLVERDAQLADREAQLADREAQVQQLQRLLAEFSESGPV